MYAFMINIYHTLRLYILIIIQSDYTQTDMNSSLVLLLTFIEQNVSNCPI